MSDAKTHYETKFDISKRSSGWLLGDSGYPLEPWLIVPYRNAAENSPEAIFNQVHSQARNYIERTIGILKGRWRILLSERKCRYDPTKLAKITTICCVLHNMCIQFNAPYYKDVPRIPQNNRPISENDITNEINANKKNVAKNIRDKLKELVC